MRLESGFANGSPRALLYLLLRHALLEGFWDTGLQVRTSLGALTPDQARDERREKPFVHVRNDGASESRWASLYGAPPRAVVRIIRPSYGGPAPTERN